MFSEESKCHHHSGSDDNESSEGMDSSDEVESRCQDVESPDGSEIADKNVESLFR